MLLLMCITIHIYISGYTKPDNLRKITRNIIRIILYYKDFCRIQEENGINKPVTGKQGQRDFNQKDYYELWTDEIFQLLSGTTYYLGLHRPTIKGLQWKDMTSG